MSQKNSPPTLSTVQSGIDELQITIKSLVNQMNKNFKKVDDRLGSMDDKFDLMDNRFGSQEKFNRSVVQEFASLRREMTQRFDKQEKLAFKWKSDIMNGIDKFAGRIRRQDHEIAAIGARKEHHEDRISRLEQKIYTQPVI